MTFLQNGQAFPHIEIAAVGGGTIRLPEDLAGSFGVILLNRGAWCPYCNAQLAAFGRAADKFAEDGIKVVSFSVDDEATAAALVAKHRLTFPVGHSASVGEVAAATGAYTSDSPRYLQSTGFILRPDGSMLIAVYSSGAIGRLVPDDVLGMIAYAKSHG